MVTDMGENGAVNAHPVVVGRGVLDPVRAGRVVGRLTLKQQQVLALASMGATEAETALELGVSVWTVKDHRRRVLQQFDARTIAEAVAFAFQQGILR